MKSTNPPLTPEQTLALLYATGAETSPHPTLLLTYADRLSPEDVERIDVAAREMMLRTPLPQQTLRVLVFGPRLWAPIEDLSADSCMATTVDLTLHMLLVVVDYVVALRMEGCAPWALLWTHKGPPPPLPA